MTTRLSRAHLLPAADPSRQAYLLLRTLVDVAPVAVGLDKFADPLTDRPARLARLAAAHGIERARA